MIITEDCTYILGGVFRRFLDAQAQYAHLLTPEQNTFLIKQQCKTRLVKGNALRLERLRLEVKRLRSGYSSNTRNRHPLRGNVRGIRNRMITKDNFAHSP